MTWDRIERLEALLKEKIAIIVLERLSDPRLGFVTITGVKLSRDKRHAKVLYTVLGTEGQRRTTERALADAARHVQEQLAPTLRMRVMPELRFSYDESIAREARMLDLLDELASRRPAGQASAQDSLADRETDAGAGGEADAEASAGAGEGLPGAGNSPEGRVTDKAGMTGAPDIDTHGTTGTGGEDSGDPRGADGGARESLR